MLGAEPPAEEVAVSAPEQVDVPAPAAPASDFSILGGDGLDAKPAPAIQAPSAMDAPTIDLTTTANPLGEPAPAPVEVNTPSTPVETPAAIADAIKEGLHEEPAIGVISAAEPSDSNPAEAEPAPVTDVSPSVEAALQDAEGSAEPAAEEATPIEETVPALGEAPAEITSEPTPETSPEVAPSVDESAPADEPAPSDAAPAEVPATPVAPVPVPTPDDEKQTEVPAPIAPAKDVHKLRTIIIAAVAAVVLIVVACLGYMLLAPGFAQKSADETPQSQKPADTTPVDPFEKLLSGIKADNADLKAITFTSADQLLDADLHYTVTINALLIGVPTAAEDTANTIIALNLDIDNQAVATALTLSSLTVNGIIPVVAPDEITDIDAFIEKYELVSLTDVAPGTTSAGWLFFEVPTSGINNLTLKYSRAESLSLPAFTAELPLTVK
jgi:hypothetical protein